MDNLWKVFIQPERSSYDPKRLDPVERELDQSTKYIRHDGSCCNEYENRLKFWLFEKTTTRVHAHQSVNNKHTRYTDGRPKYSSGVQDWQATQQFWSGYPANSVPGAVFEPKTTFYDQISRDLRCLVYIHSHGGNCLEGMHLLRVAHSLNMHLLLFDLTSHGLSEGVYSTLGLREHQDLESVLREVHIRFGLKSFVLWGRSMGAVAALGYAARHPALIDMLVLDSPFNSVEQIVRDVGGSYLKLGEYVALMMFGMIKANIKDIIGHDLGEFKPISYCDHIDVPCLFMCAKDDELVRPERVEEMFANYRCVQRNLLLVDGNHSSSRTIPDMQKAISYIAQILRVQLVNSSGLPNSASSSLANTLNAQPMKNKLEEIKSKFTFANSGQAPEGTNTRLRRETMPTRNQGDEEVLTGTSYTEIPVSIQSRPQLQPVPHKPGSSSSALKTSRSMTSLISSPSLTSKNNTINQDRDFHAWKYGNRIFSPVKLVEGPPLSGEQPKPLVFERETRPDISIERTKLSLQEPVNSRIGLTKNYQIYSGYQAVGNMRPPAPQDPAGEQTDSNFVRLPIKTTAWSPRNMINMFQKAPTKDFPETRHGKSDFSKNQASNRQQKANSGANWLSGIKASFATEPKEIPFAEKFGSSLLSGINSQADTTDSIRSHHLQGIPQQNFLQSSQQSEAASKNHKTAADLPAFPFRHAEKMSYSDTLKHSGPSNSSPYITQGPVRVLFDGKVQAYPSLGNNQFNLDQGQNRPESPLKQNRIATDLASGKVLSKPLYSDPRPEGFIINNNQSEPYKSRQPSNLHAMGLEDRLQQQNYIPADYHRQPTNAYSNSSQGFLDSSTPQDRTYFTPQQQFRTTEFVMPNNWEAASNNQGARGVGWSTQHKLTPYRTTGSAGSAEAGMQPNWTPMPTNFTASRE